MVEALALPLFFPVLGRGKPQGIAARSTGKFRVVHALDPEPWGHLISDPGMDWGFDLLNRDSLQTTTPFTSISKHSTMGWHKFPVSLRELCIDTTLRCGQSFRWKKLPDDSYNCAIHGRLISLRQDATHLHYRAIRASRKKRRTVPLTPDTHGRAAVESEEENEQEVENTRAFLQHYLNLGPNLSALYEEWSTADANFKKKAPRFAGIRILRQDAWEALVGFICSSNNNIPRISQMVGAFPLRSAPVLQQVRLTNEIADGEIVYKLWRFDWLH